MATKNPLTATSVKHRVLIVDDHPLFREGLAGIIQQSADLAVCGEADDAVTAFEEIRRLSPDVLLTDIGLPGRSGLELLKDVHAFRPSLPALVISMHDEGVYAERTLRAGGRGYIMKQEGPAKILEAISKVIEGGIYLSQKMSAEIMERFVNPGARQRMSPIGRLTDREFEVLRLVGEGKEGRQIAKDLCLSIKTVACHQANIREKLGLRSTSALVHFAARWMVRES